MGSFRASFEFGGKEYDVLYTSYSFNRDVDGKGLVASNVYGGEVTIRVQSTADTAVIESMLNGQFKPFDCKLTYKKTDEDSSMKTVEMKNGYLVRFKETLDIMGDTPMSALFTISSETVTIGNAIHENRWPKH